MASDSFSQLPDEIIVGIFLKLQDDPRHWANLACVCSKFSNLIISVCFKHKCLNSIRSIVFDLVSCPFDLEIRSPEPPGRWWSSLHKICICCPGLVHAGIFLCNSSCGPASYHSNLSIRNPTTEDHGPKRQRVDCRTLDSHLATSSWFFSREQGNKLLASRYRGDSLYVSEPGCLHSEGRHLHMLFRGFFKNFKMSSVWKAIQDGNRYRVALSCAFCSCQGIYDLYSAFCLRRFFGYFVGGEPVVRAYVCENGHVSGAWTDRPLYT